MVALATDMAYKMMALCLPAAFMPAASSPRVASPIALMAISNIFTCNVIAALVCSTGTDHEDNIGRTYIFSLDMRDCTSSTYDILPSNSDNVFTSDVAATLICVSTTNCHGAGHCIDCTHTNTTACHHSSIMDYAASTCSVRASGTR